MKILLISLALFCSSFSEKALFDETKPIEFNGYVKIDSRPCEGATITICRLSAEDCVTTIYELVTGKAGKFDFLLEPNAHYKLEVKKNGFVDRFVLFNTTMPGDRTGVLKPFPFEVQLSHYADVKEVPVQIASVYFDSVKNRLDYRIGPAK